MAEWTDLPAHDDAFEHDMKYPRAGIDGCPQYCPKKLAFMALSERDRRNLYVKPLPDYIETINEFAVRQGRNMTNHTAAMSGQPKYVQVGPYIMRTKQRVYRLAAWLIMMADASDLPDEPGAHTFEQVKEAISNA